METREVLAIWQVARSTVGHAPSAAAGGAKALDGIDRLWCALVVHMLRFLVPCADPFLKSGGRRSLRHDRPHVALLVGKITDTIAAVCQLAASKGGGGA